MKSIYEGTVPTHAMGLPALKAQGWNVVDWSEKCPDTGDYIQEFEPCMGNRYSNVITAIGDNAFLARSTNSSSCPEQIFNKHDRVYVYKKKGSEHCLINGIGADHKKHN